VRLEEEQRGRRIADKEVTPRRSENIGNGDTDWVYRGDYWKAREEGFVGIRRLGDGYITNPKGLVIGYYGTLAFNLLIMTSRSLVPSTDLEQHTFGHDDGERHLISRSLVV